MTRSLLIAVVGVMATQGCAKPAQLTRESALPLPDFRGVWFLDPKKSHLADTTRTTTLEVWRHGDTLIVETATNDQFGYSTSTGRYGFDGKPWLDATPDRRLSTVMSWDGPTLVFRTSGDMRGLKVTVIDRWSLDATTGILTRAHRLEMLGRSLTETEVFVWR